MFAAHPLRSMAFKISNDPSMICRHPSATAPWAAMCERSYRKGERTCRNDGALNNYLIGGSVAPHTAASGIGVDATLERA